MEKLMIDTGKLWVEDYKVSGFRFDLSGFHTLDNMLRFQEAVQAIDPTTYIYGEAWNFGAVQNDARFEQARQANLGGTGIGSFADRIRDPLRGSFFGENDVTTEWIQRQGFVSGWYYDPNSENTGSVTERNGLLAATDDIRLWLAGGLKSYRLQKSDGTTVSGSQLSGYTEDPQEAIVYADKHDNATLWDYSAWKHPTGTSPANRVRAQNVGQAVLLLGQGIPFVQAGSDILRSKSGDRDSYDSGDWFNEIDWTLSGNKWAEGLPIADKNDIRWPLLQTKYQDVTTKPGPAELQRSFDHFREMLRIRKSSPLFRLGNAAQIEERVQFYNTGPSQVAGLIAMGIDGCTDGDFVPPEGALMTIFNANDEPQTLNLFGSEAWTLHPVLADSTDPVVKTAKHDANGFYVPARTTAVFRRAAQTGCAPYANDLYIRGTFYDWGDPAPETYRMQLVSSTSYSLTAAVPAGAQSFKISTKSWGGAPDCGAVVDGQTVELGLQRQSAEPRDAGQHDRGQLRVRAGRNRQRQPDVDGVQGRAFRRRPLHPRRDERLGEPAAGDGEDDARRHRQVPSGAVGAECGVVQLQGRRRRLG
jgi:pullulanase-type alpha-1,6-glucosidase